MPIKHVLYEGYDIMLRDMGPPPYQAMIRPPGSVLYGEAIERDSLDEALNAARAEIDAKSRS